MKHPFHSPALARRAGMTLIEILAVLAVIVILFSILMGLTGSASVKGDKAQVAKDLALLESIIEEDRIERGVYPSRAQLDTIFDNVEFRRFDPWGADYFAHYILSPNKQAYVLGSPGPDGKVGKAFVDDDLVNGIDDLGEFGLYDDILSTARKE